jgi:hypothetical protein
MKLFLVSTTKKINKITKVILVINLLSGCAGIPARKVKLDDYPKSFAQDVRNLNLSYDYDKIRDEINNIPYRAEFEGAVYYKDNKGHFRYGSVYNKKRNEKYFDYETKEKDLVGNEIGAYKDFVDDLKHRPYFDYSIVKNLKSKNPHIVRKKYNDPGGCMVRLESANYTNFPRLCIANHFLAGFTLFTIPYYCQHTYEARATLLSHPQDSEIQGIIKNSIAKPK